MIDAPMIETSSENERRIFIKEKYPCIADCEETVVGTFHKPSSGRRMKPTNSILYIIVEPAEEVKTRL